MYQNNKQNQNQNQNQTPNQNQIASYNLIYNYLPVKINQDLRMIATDHNIWTWAHILRKVENLPDLQQVSERQLRNSYDTAQFFSQFAGRDKAFEIEKLYQDHILLGSRVIDDLYRGDYEALNRDRELWNINGEELARSFASASPVLSYDIVLNHVLNHNRMVEELARLRINKQYDDAILTFDHMVNDDLDLADYLSYGIISNLGMM